MQHIPGIWELEGIYSFNSPRVLLQRVMSSKITPVVSSFNSPRVLLQRRGSQSSSPGVRCNRFNSPRVLLQHGYTPRGVSIQIGVSILLESYCNHDVALSSRPANVDVSILLESYCNTGLSAPTGRIAFVSILLESYCNMPLNVPGVSSVDLFQFS